jgi:hypothetical protein
MPRPRASSEGAAKAAARDRKALLRAIDRDLRSKSRAKLGALKDRVRLARQRQRAAIRDARSACAARRPPTLESVRLELAAARKKARAACDVDLREARGLRTETARARAERDAEARYQKDLRAIEAHNRRKGKLRPGLSRARRGESDDEVRGNIPPELVALFDRVKRDIKSTPRKTRTEAFLEYAEAHPGEEWDALEGAIDREIAELERRQAMANPKKKSPKKRPAKRAKAKAPKRRKAKRRAAAPKKKAPKRAKAKRRAAPKKTAPKRAKAKRRAAPKKAPKRAAKTNKKRTKQRHMKPVHPLWFEPIANREVRGEMPRLEISPSYWKKHPRARRNNVMKLLRGSPRHKRTAIALARAEQRHADAPPRKRNPGMSKGEALDEYERTHWGERGNRSVRAGRAADPRFGTLTKMGDVVSITYRTKKGGDRGLTDYEHEFEGRRPTLAYNDGGLIIVGGDYKIAEEGIDG